MRIDFWFDPACPFTWITSRWMCRTAPSRSLDVRWRSLSLAILHEDDAPTDARQRSLGQLRVVEAVRKAGLEDRIGELYTELGVRTHDHQDRSFPVTDALAACGLPLALADASDDDSYDGLIRASMDEASALAGDDTGVPVIAWESDGDRIGFFGPILTELPEVDAGVRLFDAVAALASVPAFSELKRTKSRPVLPAT
jgi:predicted DsbA family dithiol-disulfide isomerase